MKKILIIQTDEPYFLFETIQVLEKSISSLAGIDLSLLVNSESIFQLPELVISKQINVITDFNSLLDVEFEMSFNLSQNQPSWELHSKIKSKKKVGAHYNEGRLIIPDLWSSYYVTLKGGMPFLTFHLQDIYKNILGLKNPIPAESKNNFTTVAFGHFNPEFMTGIELEALIENIQKNHPLLLIRDISEIDLISDLTKVLYIGPADLQSVRICEGGATGIILTRYFQGFNLLPYGVNHHYISSNGKQLRSKALLPIVEKTLTHQSLNNDPSLSKYQIDFENLFGAYLKSYHSNDENYPIYKTQVVLWNFLLNLFEVNLDLSQCSAQQEVFLQNTQIVLKKMVRLHDYAMVAVGNIHKEAQLETPHIKILEQETATLLEVESVFDKISKTRSMLRPFIDFYKIRKGQNEGETLLEQAQNTLVTYSEEHHALKALDELFSVTLKKNEVNI